MDHYVVKGATDEQVLKVLTLTDQTGRLQDGLAQEFIEELAERLPSMDSQILGYGALVLMSLDPSKLNADIEDALCQ